MLAFLLLASSLLPTQLVSTQCVDRGADTATIETQAVPGPSGTTAALRVSTSDDHSKNSHECNADYTLTVTPANGGAPQAVDLLASDGDYGRGLSMRLDGFSSDGKHVFGILTEGGKYPATFLFDYDTSGGPVEIIDLKKQFVRIMGAACMPAFDVVGTSVSGSIVVEMESRGACAENGRWVIDRGGRKPERLSAGARVLNLYPN
jgi:hypothetical protein